MNDEEKRVFYFDMEDLVWEEALQGISFGLRLYAHKDPKETIEPARRRMFKLKIAHYVLVSLLFYLVLLILYKTVLYLF